MPRCSGEGTSGYQTRWEGGIWGGLFSGTK